MDTFLNSLDGRLRVSGMVADSIMMGIVNSAMDDAYKKSCTKEGDLERLNEKSRFCELAIMQLEWCLRYLQEETVNNILNESCDREGLLYDLLETRDRIHRKLEMTKLAIAEKDRELLEKKEVEVDLRLALEMRDEDIRSLHTALGLQRTNNEMAERSLLLTDKLVEKKGVHLVNELKDTLDQQIQKNEHKLEKGKLNLIEMMKGEHSRLLSLENLESGCDFDVQERTRITENIDCNVVRKAADGARTLKDELMVQLVLDLDEMVVCVDMIRGKLDTYFEILANYVSSFKTVLKEQHWIWNFEKETINLINQEFLRDMQAKFSNELEAYNATLMPSFLKFDFSTIMDDFRKLHNLLDIFSSRIKMQSKAELRANHHLSINLDADGQDKLNHGNSVRSESLMGNCVFSEVLGLVEDDKTIVPSDGFCRINGANALVEGDSCKFFAKPRKPCCQNEQYIGYSSVNLVSEKTIRNNGHAVQRKTQDINWIKKESAERNGSLASRDQDSIHFLEVALPHVISMFEFIIAENPNLSAVSNAHESSYGKDQKVIKYGVSEIHLYAEASNKLCCQLATSEFIDERRQLEQEKFDLEMKSMISDNIYLLLLKGLTERIHCESIEGCIEGQFMEEISKIVLSRMFADWRNYDVICKTESLIIQELYSLVFTTVVKDLVLSLNCTSKLLPHECSPSNEKLYQICQGNGMIINQTDKVRRESCVSLECIGHDLESAIKYSPNAKLLKRDYELNFVNEIFYKPTQQISLSELQFGKFPSRAELVCGDVTSICDQENGLIYCGQYASKNPKNEEQHFCWFHFLIISFVKISQLFLEFEHVVHDKIHLNVERLKFLACDLVPLVKQVNSVKQSELLYQKAFIRRCFDLQTAEEEMLAIKLRDSFAGDPLIFDNPKYIDEMMRVSQTAGEATITTLKTLGIIKPKFANINYTALFPSSAAHAAESSSSAQSSSSSESYAYGDISGDASDSTSGSNTTSSSGASY